MSIDLKIGASQYAEYPEKIFDGVRESALDFSEEGSFATTMARYVKSGVISKASAALSLKSLCKSFCKSTGQDQAYKIAHQFQRLAKQYDPEAGNEAMSSIIKSQVAHLNFLEISGNLMEAALALFQEDREFGLQALMSIAKKFATLESFKEAMRYTQMSWELKDTKMCNRIRKDSHDILPFREMGYHMLKLKQYGFAEECARKLDRHCSHRECLFADIIVKQIQEENFINTHLLSELKPNTLSWSIAYDGLALSLIDHKRYKESLVYAKKRLEAEGDFGKQQFTEELREKILKSLGIDPTLWLKLNISI